FAVTENVVDCPWFTVAFDGWLAIVTGRIAGVTVMVSVWVATTPLFAEIVTVKGEPVWSGGVPLSTPEVGLSDAHDGRFVAENVTAVELLAVTVNVCPVFCAWNDAVLGLVIVGGVPTDNVAADDSATGETPLLATTRN